MVGGGKTVREKKLYRFTERDASLKKQKRYLKVRRDRTGR